MGFFSKIFDALKKTKDGLAQKLRQLFARDKIGEDFYEDLEDIEFAVRNISRKQL